MKGDALKKYPSGSKLEFQAKTFNTFVDAARQMRQRSIDNGAARARQALRHTGIVVIKNNSGADVERFGVLGVDRALFTPTENLDSFQNHVLLSGIRPAASVHAGKFVIALEPIKSGKIGPAYIDGVCPARITFAGEEPFADVKDNDLASLQAATTGSARVLWKEPGTGVKWAIVLLGEGGGALSTGQYQYMDYTMVAQNSAGWDFARLHNLI